MAFIYVAPRSRLEFAVNCSEFVVSSEFIAAGRRYSLIIAAHESVRRSRSSSGWYADRGRRRRGSGFHYLCACRDGQSERWRVTDSDALGPARSGDTGGGHDGTGGRRDRVNHRRPQLTSRLGGGTWDTDL